jgi:hypothetical protein
MLDLFSPLTTDAQRAHRREYRQFLTERDGLLDIEKRTLSRREEGMLRYTRPLSRVRDIDRALFHQQRVRFDAKRRTPSEVLLLLALVKLNEGEAYGVSQTFDYVKRQTASDPDQLELLLHIEEDYHTRILLSSAVPYGVEISEPVKPTFTFRTLIAGIAHAPELISRPLILAGEIMGTLTFLNVLHLARETLKHDPELRDAIEERLTDVLIDEIGHISFNRMLLGPGGLARTRLLLPLVAEGIAHAMPVLSAIGLRPSAAGAATVTTDARLPDAVRQAAFVV